VFAIWAGEMAQVAFVVRAHMGGEVSPPGEGMGTEWVLETEIWEEQGHGDLIVVVAVALFAESLVFEGMTPGGIVAFPMRVELVKLVGGKRGDAEE